MTTRYEPEIQRKKDLQTYSPVLCMIRTHQCVWAGRDNKQNKQQYADRYTVEADLEMPGVNKGEK